MSSLHLRITLKESCIHNGRDEQHFLVLTGVKKTSVYSCSRNLRCASASGTVLVDAGNFKMAPSNMQRKRKYFIYNMESRFYLDF